jgi:hypothetical protein
MHHLQQSGPLGHSCCAACHAWHSRCLLWHRRCLTLTSSVPLTAPPATAPCHRYFSALNYAFQGYLRADLAGRAYDCSNTSDPGVSALGLFPQLLPETPELAPVKTVLLEQQGGGFLQGCVARGDVILLYYGMTSSFVEVVAILLGYLAVTYVIGYLALVRAASRVAGAVKRMK